MKNRCRAWTILGVAAALTGAFASGCSSSASPAAASESQVSELQALSIPALKRPAGELLDTFPATPQTISDTGGLIRAWEIYPYRSTLRTTGPIYAYGVVIVGVDASGGVHSAIQVRAMKGLPTRSVEVAVLTGTQARVIVEPTSDASSLQVAYRRAPSAATAHISALSRDTQVFAASAPKTGFGTKAVGCWGAVGGAFAFVEGLFFGGAGTMVAGGTGFLDNFMSCYANQQLDSNINYRECLTAAGDLSGIPCVDDTWGKDSKDRGKKGSAMDDLLDCPIRDDPRCAVCPDGAPRAPGQFCSDSLMDLMGLPATTGYLNGLLPLPESHFLDDIGHPLTAPGYVPQGGFVDGTNAMNVPTLVMDGY